MIGTASGETVLRYRVNDADEHSMPRRSACVDYIDPDQRDMAIHTVTLADGRQDQVSNGRPRDHCFVAPFPEENVPRAVEAAGIEPIVFGADFPHGEGLPDPSAYLGQIAAFDEVQQEAIMRGNLARFLAVDA